MHHRSTFTTFPTNVEIPRPINTSNKIERQSAKSSTRRRRIRSPINLIGRGQLRHAPREVISVLSRVARKLVPSTVSAFSHARAVDQIYTYMADEIWSRNECPGYLSRFLFENVYVTYGGSSRGSVDRKAILSRHESRATWSSIGDFNVVSRG